MLQGQKVIQEVAWIVIRLSSILSKDEIATYTGYSLATVWESKRGQEQRKGKLHDVDLEILFGSIRKQPDYYLDELQEIMSTTCGVEVSKATVWRTLHKAGFTIKKMKRVAVECSAEKQLEYSTRIGQYAAHQLVFVDESSVDHQTTYRGFAWSIRGTAVQRKAFFVRGQQYSVLLALSLNDGIIHCEIVEGLFCMTLFQHFINDLLDHMEPYPGPNSVIVMDNCPIHKHQDIVNTITAHSMHCEFLPPYSPDLNPIELAFSAMKYHLRRNGDYVRMAMTQMSKLDIYLTLLQALYLITPEDAYGWYQHCGYVQ
ncbi:hypothetical protein AX14_003833 [Amanita brunnescens Koide BX004]|nr:hypothetical protein AX14_003833 [Amanita brunnescens Koide BX004]